MWATLFFVAPTEEEDEAQAERSPEANARRRSAAPEMAGAAVGESSLPVVHQDTAWDLIFSWETKPTGVAGVPLHCPVNPCSTTEVFFGMPKETKRPTNRTKKHASQ